MRHEWIAMRENCLLLIIDIQQAMVKVMERVDEVVGCVNQLCRAADVLDIPIVLTEQYKKGLGPTIPEVIGEVSSPAVFEKEHFSACLEPDFTGSIRAYNRPEIVLAGMETHVCVLQTALDLLHAGFRVHLVADAVCSRVDNNRDVAVDQLRHAGAVVTSTEIVIFEWARRANTDAFRRILPIVK